MASSSDDKSLALYCDFENIALGVRDAKYQKFDISHILERLLVKGSIVVKKAYCDWDRYKNFKGPMHEAAFELIEIPHVRMSGKNSADIRMVVDALDLCYTKSHVDTFVIISGDSDFSPLVSKLRENAKTVIGVGVKNSTSDLLISSCDEFIYYDDLVREIERGRSPASRKRTGRKRSSRSTRTEVKVEERDEKDAPQATSPADGAGRNSRTATDRADEGKGEEANEPAGEVTMTLEEAAGSRASEPAPGESADRTVAAEADSIDAGSSGSGSEEGGSSATGRKASGRRRSRGHRAVTSGEEGVDAEGGDRSGDADVMDASASDVAEVTLDEAVDDPAAESSDEADAASRSKKKTAKRASRKKAATKKVATKKAAAKKKASKKVVSAKTEDGAAASAVAADPIAVLQKDDRPTLDDDDSDDDTDEDDEDDESTSETPEELAQEGLDIMLETALALTSERGGSDKLWGSMIKQTLKRRRPGFNESYYGFESFGKMLEEAESRGFLSLEHDDRSGGYIITKIST